MPAFVFGSLQFDAPARAITATQLSEVLPVLDFAEREAKAGAYVAVMMSYEAAPAFDSVLAVHEPSEFPLAWAAAFDAATDLASSDARLASNSWTPRVSRVEYDDAVSRIKDLIAAGDTYQVNYSFPLAASFDGDAYAWYRTLCEAQGAQYSPCIDLGRYRVLSLWPELFFERCGDRVVTKPMRGTVRRGRWTAEDEKLTQWLKQSTKDRAEKVVIVDLLRNDLGKVSVPGSVHRSEEHT